MARVTVEDCLENVKNRFELVMIASKRARQLMRGSAEPKVAWENDKATVVALREIAMGYTDFSDAHHVDIVPQAPQEEAVIISMDLDDDEDEIIIIEENTIDTTIDTTDTTPSSGSNDPEQIDPLDDNPTHEASITGTSSQSK